MLGNLQTFVQRRFHALLMLSLAAGFLLIFLELVLYRHFEGLQIIGTASTVIGALLALVGIGASGNLRRILAVAFLALSLVGLLGVFEHNEERFEGEERRPPAAQTTGDQASGESGENEQGESEEAGEAGEEGEEEGEGEETPPPPLAPLGVAGLYGMGAVALLGRKDPA